MTVQITLTQRFLKVLRPTTIQVLACAAVALGILIVAQRPSVVWFSSTDQGPIIDASVAELHDRTQTILQSQIASTSALIGFWAVVGLVAYLVCWMAYNAMIEARNKVTLETQYTNRGHWRGAYETLILKTLCALALCAALVTIQPAVEFWTVHITPILSGIQLMPALWVIAGIIGLTLHLYIVLTCVVLTFSPWYRAEAFTEVAE